MFIVNTTTIREELHHYLEVVDDKKVKAIYAVMQDGMRASAVDYTVSFKVELDARSQSFENGSAKMITKTVSENRIQKLLKKGIAK
jgi:hypothetical protein